MKIRLQNTRRGPVVGTNLVKAADGSFRNIGAKTHFINSGQVVDFDGGNPAVKIYAKAGYLVPVDDAGREWLAKIQD